MSFVTFVLVKPLSLIEVAKSAILISKITQGEYHKQGTDMTRKSTVHVKCMQRLEELNVTSVQNQPKEKSCTINFKVPITKDNRLLITNSYK